jgi:hypothetical protein
MLLFVHIRLLSMQPKVRKGMRLKNFHKSYEIDGAQALSLLTRSKKDHLTNINSAPKV